MTATHDRHRERVLEALDELVDTDGAARLLDVKAASVTRYRLRDGSFPPPLVRFGRGTTPVWLRADIVAWQASRPGRGAGGGRPRREAAS